MKVFGHPLHLMLIHFPAALFPMDFVCYYIFYINHEISFNHASFYALIGGVMLGWLSIVTGLIDLLRLKDNGALQAKALIHGSVNTIVVLGYTILAAIVYKYYPKLPVATVTLVVIKVFLNILMIAGNYLGGNLVLKERMGVSQPNSKTL